VSHTFEFTNRGNTHVAIDRVVASCGCTTSEYPKTPIAPGASATIKATFDPRDMPGDFSKIVSVVSGGSKNINILTITGNVIPRPKSIEEEFPHTVGGGVRVSTDLLAFRTVAQGHSAAMVADYINTSPEAVTLAFEQADSSGALSVVAPETVCAGCRGNITFTYDLTVQTVYGDVHDVTRVVVNGTPSTKTIYSAMTGVDDFEGVDMALAPRFFLGSSFHDFGEVRRRTVPHTLRLVASNEGTEVLHIRSVSESDGLKSTLRGGMTIAPGAELPFEVILYSGKYPAGPLQESIRMVVDDPMRPTREIRIAATIQ
jgi:hypothetical protein